MAAFLQNPQSDYVLAAYGIAGAALLALLYASWRAYRLARRQANQTR